MEPIKPTKRIRMTEAQAADYMGIAERTLTNRRHAGKCPPYIKMGNRIYFDQADIDAYLDSLKVIPVPKTKSTPTLDLAEAIGL